MTATNSHSRLIVVSNRLPFSAKMEGGSLQFGESTGGLVTGLASYLDSIGKGSEPVSRHLWVGWPGTTVEETQREWMKVEAMKRYSSLPVFLSQEEMEQFYFGFCNKTIWPLFHYFPSYVAYEEPLWEQYKHVNTIFCDTLVDIIRPDDIVWVHDYHLMLLPRMLKARVPDVPVGFFLHIPFPSFEIFRLLPARWRRDLLEGFLGADLIGFHTYEYAQHFLQSVLRILGHDHQMGQIVTAERVVKVDAYPIGIDFEKFAVAQVDPEVLRDRQSLKESLPDVRIILSVDRLDYSKGILNRLEAFEILLGLHPEFHGKVVLLMVVVPSRIGVDQYALMKKQIEELVGSINGKFGRIGWTPVVYQYRQMQFLPLSALYGASDVCLVTPLRDGMNLVAKEYVASRSDGTGVLILSEMAGSVKELGEAIIVNPNNRVEIAEAMREALEVPVQEQKRRMRSMQNRLQRYTVKRWASEVVDQLVAMRDVQDKFCAKVLTQSVKRRIAEQYEASSSRTFFLDYDGTLAPIVRHPDLAAPGELLLSTLRELTSDTRNTVVIVSGRDRGTLTNWFGNLPIGLIAEHGIWMKAQGREWYMLKQYSNDWKNRLLPILEHYADRVPGAFVEVKEHSLVWHYRNADPDQGRILASELIDHLFSFTATIDVHVLRGNKVVEIRNAGVDKGTATLEWFSGAASDFALAIGDDWTDEDMFRALPESTITIRVGIVNTNARYNLRNQGDVLKLLDFLLHGRKQEEEAGSQPRTVNRAGG